MAAAQAERTPAFLAGLPDPGFLERFAASRLGATTHISVADADGWACAVTCTNGEGCGEVVPGTGIHLNNMMGEQDLSPFGWHAHPPGRRLPSMMSPTIVLAPDGLPRLVLGSAGSNRIRSAVLQVVIGVLDHGLGVQAAIDAPRVHFEDEIAYVEPGVDVAGLEAQDRAIVRFSARNLFFGGAQAVQRDPATGALSGGRRPAPRRCRRASPEASISPAPRPINPRMAGSGGELAAQLRHERLLDMESRLGGFRRRAFAVLALALIASGPGSASGS